MKILALLLLLPVSAFANTPPLAKAAKPKNLVIMIGDGMGPAYTSAYRYFRDNPDTEEIEQTVFDRLLTGMASTYPAPVSGYVTDSAAAATAMATGYKSYNGAISVDVERRPLQTLFEAARQAGLATGITVTSQINHATPAAFLTHNESRSNYQDIARAMLDSDAQVLLGGGRQYFDEALLADFAGRGYARVTDLEALEQLHSGKVLGLFADVQLPAAIDNPGAQQLSRLTQKALELLSQHQQGFVLLVEGSLIDWAGHDNDIVTALGEMDEFARAIEVVEAFVRGRGDTLLLITADHETGGLSLGARDQYQWNAGILRGVSASPEAMAAEVVALAATAPQQQAVADWQSVLERRLGFALDNQELSTLSEAQSQGTEALATAIKRLLDNRSFTGWTGSGHTAQDVQVFAKGPAAELFIGQQDNTELAQKLMSLLPAAKR